MGGGRGSVGEVSCKLVLFNSRISVMANGLFCALCVFAFLACLPFKVLSVN